MQNFILLVSCFAFGILCQKWKRFPENTAQVLNAFVIAVSLPALIFLKVPKMLTANQTPEYAWLPVLTMWLMFFVCWLLVHWWGQKRNWSKPKIGALILTTGLANTSFVGIPILKSLLGDKALPFAILADQPGEFLIVSTLGVLVASFYSGHQVTVRDLAKRVITFPPFVALVFCIVTIKLSPFQNPLTQGLLQTLADTLVPLALFAVGYQCKFNFAVLHRRAPALIPALFLRLFAIPFLVLLSCYFLFKNQIPLAAHVTILESAMATQITAAVVANEFHLDGEIANLMVAISIPISLLSVPLWHHLINVIFV